MVLREKSLNKLVAWQVTDWDSFQVLMRRWL